MFLFTFSVEDFQKIFMMRRIPTDPKNSSVDWVYNDLIGFVFGQTCRKRTVF